MKIFRIGRVWKHIFFFSAQPMILFQLKKKIKSTKRILKCFELSPAILQRNFVKEKIGKSYLKISLFNFQVWLINFSIYDDTWLGNYDSMIRIIISLKRNFPKFWENEYFSFILLVKWRAIMMKEITMLISSLLL